MARQSWSDFCTTWESIPYGIVGTWKTQSVGWTAVRGSVNHSFAAVRYLLEHYHGRVSPCGPLTVELLAYAAGAHHGLFGCVDADHRSGFQHRMEKEDICYEEAVGNFLQYCAGEEELDTLFAEARQRSSKPTGSSSPCCGRTRPPVKKPAFTWECWRGSCSAP